MQRRSITLELSSIISTKIMLNYIKLMKLVNQGQQKKRTNWSLAKFMARDGSKKQISKTH